MKVIIIPGLFGGLERRYYVPLAGIFGQTDFEIFRAGADWNPAKIANSIRQIGGKKVVICLSLGAMVGNMVANDKDTDVYCVCPFLGNEFNRRTYPRKLRVFFRGLAVICMIIAWPFKWHRWFPLFGGTRPDGHFLSVYAIFQQLWYSFRKTPKEIRNFSGVVYSRGDTTVDPGTIKNYFPNAIAAKRPNGEDPRHSNFRGDGDKFGKAKVAVSGNGVGEDAKAYIAALSSLLHS